MGTAKWIYCPICKNKTRTKIRTDTREYETFSVK